MSPSEPGVAKTWFITGTDTNAGKTSVARALLLAGRKRGLRSIGYKPIESGAQAGQGFGPDAMAMAEAADAAPESSFVFEAPIAPLLAAEAADKRVSLSEIRTKAAELQTQADLLIIEGAGGLLVPLTREETIADLAMALKQPLLIVAADCLGAINHSLLTLEAARTRGLKVDALILSERVKDAGQGLDNEAQIRSWDQVPVLRLPHANSEEALSWAGEAILAHLLTGAKAGEKVD